MIELDDKYSPKSYEDKWYGYWNEKGYFFSEKDDAKEPYTILMPPPNVTSQLHMGHGTGYTIQDLLIRWKRMKGFNACWLPGTDHAGIATQMMVEKEIAKDGLTKTDLGRDKFVGKLQDWKDKYGGMILDQFKKMGFSCDWSRIAYTMDPVLSKAVRKVFVELYNEGLIYRGERLVNWDVVLKTAISDDEVESKEVPGHLWYFRYPVDGTDKFIPIATTRPETMLGDTAVAVNPEDERFKDLIGKNIKLPFTDRLIPVVADDYVKSEFGTGAVKITPAHDPNDFEIGQRHNLPFISILNDDGTMNDVVPDRFKGLDRFVARKEVIKGLKELDLFDEEESYKHAIPFSERSKTVIEPKLSKQWYVKMSSLAKPAADAARSDELTFSPESWKKTYLYWLDNIQDWCISRQLWWGHRIPIWYCNDCDGVTTGMEDPTTCSKCGGTNIRQDEDVLDTWFSSWLWPMSPFGWPEQDKTSVEDLAYYNPTNVLVTAPEIIFLWVARMVMANLKFQGRLPFKHVYFNATICDKQGRKFSKTLGNGIDPLEVIDKHGADAVRYTAVSLAPLGGRVKMEHGDFDNGARFMNKIWNAARFLLKYIDPKTELPSIKSFEPSMAEKWLLDNFAETAAKVDKNLEVYRVNDAVEDIHHFIWGCFCDWGLENAKASLNGDDEERKLQTISVLVYALNGALRLAHPVVPFITEEIWQKLPSHPDWDKADSITIAKFPEESKLMRFKEDAALWESIQQIVSSIRAARQTAGISPKEPLDAHIKVAGELKTALEEATSFVQKLAKIQNILISEDIQRPAQSLTQVGKGYEVFIPVEGLVDLEKEKTRLTNESTRISKIIIGLEKKLSNDNFVKRAPEAVVVQSKAQLENMKSQLDNIKTSLDALS